MKITEKIERAIQRSAILHDGQRRSGGDKPPYVTHLVSVAWKVAENTDDEDVIVAALMHDSVEDTDYTFEELSKEFGDRVTEIVKGVTIPEAVGESDWEKDRREYILNLKSATKESAMVSASDKIHNFNSILENYSDDIDGFKKAFKGSKDDRLKVYSIIVGVIKEKLGTHPLTTELEETFKKYEAFLANL